MSALRHLLQEMERRRPAVRAALWTTRSGSPQCFPNWTLHTRLRHRYPRQPARRNAKARHA
jgi:hypothetical protein